MCNQNVIAFQARNKPADGGGHVNQKGQAGQKTPVAGQKSGQTKAAQKPAQKPPTAQKGQVKTQPKAAAVKGGKKTKKGQRHQQHDLIVTINLVSRPHHCLHEHTALVRPSILGLPTLHFIVDHN
jgi:pSer/pThr/pTyr-binding forkhead associated (FHA) protein